MARNNGKFKNTPVVDGKPVFKKCACGCGTNIAPKATFRPGHDARMVSLAVRATVASKSADLPFVVDGFVDGDDIQNHINLVADYIAAKFSKALAVKFDTAAMNAWDKAVNVKAPKTAKRSSAKVNVEGETVFGTVKVGRWTYPAQTMIVDGKVRMNINDTRDGKGDWLDAEGHSTKPQSFWLAKFVPNA